MATKDLATVAFDPNNVPALTMPIADVQAAIAENVGTFKPSDLTRIKVPSGGALVWTLDTLEGKKSVDSMIAVIGKQLPSRLYWKQSLDQSGTKTPPDCYSVDGFNGIGDPGGICAKCPLNEWESSTKAGSKGKACQERKDLYLLMEGSLLPVRLSLPPSALKKFKSYMLAVASQGKKYWAVVTRFSLVEAKNAQGTVFSEVTPSFVQSLSADQAAAVGEYMAGFSEALEAAHVAGVKTGAAAEDAGDPADAGPTDVKNPFDQSK